MIVLLTYDHAHRKTQDVTWRLMSLGHWGQIRVVATPWNDRPQRHYLYGHRPAERHWPCEPTADPKEFFPKLGIPYELSSKAEVASKLKGVDLVVVGGAGILKPAVVNDYKVLNVHPGLLPARRGLDVLKWAVIECAKVGVTAHICNEETDLGWKISDATVPVYKEDTFHTFAMRQYEMELNLLSVAVQQALDNEKSDFPPIEAGETVARRRMPVSVEADLLPAFERYKLVYA